MHLLKNDERSGAGRDAASGSALEAGILWGVLTGIALLLVDSADLLWTPYVVGCMGILAMLVTKRRQLYSLPWQTFLALVFVGLTRVSIMVEAQAMAEVPPPPVEPRMVISDVPAEELPGAYAGVRELNTGKLAAVVLFIRDVTSGPAGADFRYSLFEGQKVEEGKGQVFRTTKTLFLTDLTTLRFQKENGTITLRSLSGRSFRLTRRET